MDQQISGVTIGLLIALAGLAWRVGVLTNKLETALKDVDQLKKTDGERGLMVATLASDMGWIKGQLHELIGLLGGQKGNGR